MTRKIKKNLAVIGWREWLSLPDLGLLEIKAKIDTGARSSAIHAFNVRTFKRNEKTYVRFKVHPYQHDTSLTAVAEAELAGYRRVRNPGGNVELRPCIKTKLHLLGRQWRINLTLTNRDMMGFRMLLGRQAVRKRFLVNPGQSFLAGKTAGNEGNSTLKVGKRGMSS